MFDKIEPEQEPHKNRPACACGTGTVPIRLYFTIINKVVTIFVSFCCEKQQFFLQKATVSLQKSTKNTFVSTLLQNK
jgi:hypothetical protein